MELRCAALTALELDDPDEKLSAVNTMAAAVEAWKRGDAEGDSFLDTAAALIPSKPLPGRPERPELVHPTQVPRRSPHTAAGRAALMHAVAHIEFNAVNLALDALWRFPNLPAKYYLDWSRVAVEEAQHFALVRDYLRDCGCAYGDFSGHDGLWDMVDKTRNDPTARMALVPRTLEARGLDATPPMQRKLAQAGDSRAVAVLDIILRDEVGHVAIGNHWYRWCCAREGLDPVTHYAALADRYGAPKLKGPFNLEARSRAGFTTQELALLTAAAVDPKT